MRSLLVTALLALLSAASSAGVEQAAGKAAALVAAEPAGTERLFSASFFRQISLRQLNAVFSGLYAAHGAVSETVLMSSGPFTGHFFFDTASGWRIPVALSLDRDSGLIDGIFFSPAYRLDPALAEVKERISALPGRKALLIMRLGKDAEPLEALNPDEELAAGPAYRLYLLGEVLRQGAPWERIVKLRDSDRSAPPGPLNRWPAGSPLTVHTLAALTLAEGDDTASDALLRALGRRSVEHDLTALGHSAPGLLEPFLKTSEALRLQASTGEALKYINLPRDERYGFLDGLAREPLTAKAFGRGALGLDKIGWAASPADLCRLMAFFAGRGDEPALGLLELGRPPVQVPGGYLYAGGGGGGFPGLYSAVWLLSNAGSGQFCLAAVWNDEEHDLRASSFLGPLRSALEALSAD